MEPTTEEMHTEGTQQAPIGGPAASVPTEMPRKKHLAGVVGVLVMLGFCILVSAPGAFPKGGIFTISPGDSLRTISDKLVSEHYVRSRTAFVTLVTLFGGERSMASGDYYFAQQQSVVGVARQLARGDHQLDPVKVTIPEGRNVREIGILLGEKLPGFAVDMFVEQALQYEGYLFPDTYFLYPKTQPESVIEEMRAMYKKRTTEVLSGVRPLGKSASDVVIMASIIEREARGDDDRSVVSGILWNRIGRGMALQVDASVAYAKGVPEGTVKKADLGIDSPYNTYIYRGLPPGPIANPGIEALTAAMRPAKTDYLYYIHDSRGTIHYAKTYPEHQRNINRYLK